MNYKIIPVWLAHGDGGERGTGPIIGICTTKPIANTIAKGKAWYGADGIVTEGRALQITEDNGDKLYFLLGNFAHPVTMDENLVEIKKNLVRAAKAKLTDFELEILGLKRD